MRKTGYYLLFILSLVVICGCGKDDDVIPDKACQNGQEQKQEQNKKKKEKQEPKDPEGTKAIDLIYKIRSIGFRNDEGNYLGTLRWSPPNNFDLTVYTYGLGLVEGKGVLSRAYLTTVGRVNKLEDIKSVPQSGWLVSIQNNSYFNQVKIDESVECQIGYGYIVRYEAYKTFKRTAPFEYEYADIVDPKPTYLRVYVIDKIVDEKGELIGVKLKYQMPFIP